MAIGFIEADLRKWVHSLVWTGNGTQTKSATPPWLAWPSWVMAISSVWSAMLLNNGESELL